MPQPIYALGPCGRYAVTDLRRLQTMRPGYGYAVPGLSAPPKVPDVFIYRPELDAGKRHDPVSLADIAAIPLRGRDVSNGYHGFNQLLVSPDSKRFAFLHRWRDGNGLAGRFHRRMFTVGRDGSELCSLDNGDYLSHFVWRDPEHICAWAKSQAGKAEAVYLFKDKMSQVQPVGHGVMNHNRHNTYLPATADAWILNDTYPLAGGRQECISIMYQQKARGARTVLCAGGVHG